MIRAELALFKAALNKGSYRYLHLISGHDFPIKSQDFIHQFCEQHDGVEFVHTVKDSKVYGRCRYYWLFRELPTENIVIRTFKKCLCRGLLYIQRAIEFNRFRDFCLDSIHYGSQWCSITNDFARYIVANERFIKQHFRFTNCCDEIYKQTLLHLSPFKNNVSSDMSNCRLIRFDGIHPVIFDHTNEEELKNSPMLFARKFDIDKEPQTLLMIKRLTQ